MHLSLARRGQLTACAHHDPHSSLIPQPAQQHVRHTLSPSAYHRMLQPCEQSQTPASLFNRISRLPRCTKSTPNLAVMSPWDNSLLLAPKKTSPHGKWRLLYNSLPLSPFKPTLPDKTALSAGDYIESIYLVYDVCPGYQKGRQ